MRRDATQAWPWFSVAPNQAARAAMPISPSSRTKRASQPDSSSVELINRLLLGEAEQTIGIKYESTLDGRNAAHHERSERALGFQQTRDIEAGHPA